MPALETVEEMETLVDWNELKVVGEIEETANLLEYLSLDDILDERLEE